MDFGALISGAVDGIFKAAVAAGVPEDEARAKIGAALVAHAGTIAGQLAASDADALAARTEADATIAAGRPKG